MKLRQTVSLWLAGNYSFYIFIVNNDMQCGCPDVMQAEDRKLVFFGSKVVFNQSIASTFSYSAKAGR